MTEPVAETTPEVAPQETPEQGATAEQEKDWAAEAAKWKATSLKIEARANAAAAEAKANAQAAQRLREIEDRDLSDLQRAQKELEDLRTRADVAEKTALRQQVALDKGIPANLALKLTGGTLDELSAAADELIAWRNAAAPVVPPAPKPDPSQGAQAQPAGALEDAEWEQFRAHVFPNHQ